MSQKSSSSTTGQIFNEIEKDIKQTQNLIKKEAQQSREAEKKGPPTTREFLTYAQERTGTHYFPKLDPPNPPTTEQLNELLARHKASVDQLSAPFSIYHGDLSRAQPQPLRWLWQDRLPLGGITLLDGDSGSGKSRLALQIAASVSSGSPLPDGSPTIVGGVVIVSPDTDARTKQLPILKALGAELSRIKILSFTQEDVPEFHTSGHRPFSLPEDFPALSKAIKSVNARLVIFDPFIDLIGRKSRCTNDRLSHLLLDLNTRFIERDIACLLIRTCPAKGGNARPSVLERSGHFASIATSHLLLSPDPYEASRWLLAHVKSNILTPLTPTLTLEIHPSSETSAIARMTVVGSHSLSAKDLLENRPDTLHRRLLCQHLRAFIAHLTDPIPVTTLYAHFPQSSESQIQRALKDLRNLELITHPSHGLYASTPANPTFPLNATAPTHTNPQPAKQPDHSAATTPDSQPAAQLDHSAAKNPDPQPAKQLDHSVAKNPIPESASELKSPAARTPIPESASELKSSATITSVPESASELKSSAATTFDPESVPALDAPAATTPPPQPTSVPVLTCLMDDRVREKIWRETYLGDPYPSSIEAERLIRAAYRRFVDSLDPNAMP